MTAVLFDQGELFEVASRGRHGAPKRCGVCNGSQGWVIPNSITYVMRRGLWLKIGKTKHLSTRLRELAAPWRQQYIVCPEEMDRSLPLGVVFTIEGDVEHELHERFAADHARGEWFHRRGEIAAWADEQRRLS